MPAWARGETLTHGGIRKGFDQVSGASIDLAIGEGQFGTGGRMGHAIAVNGSVPGPLVRLREGQDVRLNVTNTLATDSSIHWHGILVPFQFDGVPGVSFPGIKPGETFTAAFKVRQNGTYWWHSHSGLQEQAGHYGPIVIDPAGPDPYAADRDYVVLLSEFTPMHPHKIMDKLKKGNAYFNYQKTTLTDDYPLSAKDRLMWGKMRMMPTDILDISGSAYTYLLNGHGPDDNLELMFRPGERVRLRFINGSAMSFFNIRIPGLAMTVVAADGQNIRPVEIDEFQIGTAETYDVIVEPKREQAFAIVAEAMDRSGMGVAMLTPAKGMRADVPALREPHFVDDGRHGDERRRSWRHGYGIDSRGGPRNARHGSQGYGACFAEPGDAGLGPRQGRYDGGHGNGVDGGHEHARHIASAATGQGRSGYRHGCDEPDRPYRRSRSGSRQGRPPRPQLSPAVGA